MNNQAKILSVGNDVCLRRVPTYKITEKKRVKIFLSHFVAMFLVVAVVAVEFHAP